LTTLMSWVVTGAQNMFAAALTYAPPPRSGSEARD
jgi:hypothetical protein